MNTLLITLALIGQQPSQGPRPGISQQSWNREVEASLQKLADTLEARNNEVTEIGKLIQSELETQGTDVDKLRQQINAITARMAAKDDAKPQQEPLPAGAALIGFGLLFTVIGILAVNCVRLWLDVRVMKTVRGFLGLTPCEVTTETRCQDNARPVPDLAYK